MTHAASFGLSAELRRALEDACDGGKDAIGGLQVRIVDEAFALTATLPGATTVQQLSESVAPLLDVTAPCFFLLRLPKLGWALASWVPDTSDVRQRMLHSSGRETLRRTVAALTPLAFEAHWASASEADVAGLFAEPTGELATLALLTDVERLALIDAKATAAEAAAGKVTSAALAFPLQPLAADALAEFEKGARDLLLLRIEGESVGLLPSPTSPPAKPDPLEAILPTDAPCYALMRYPQEVLALPLPTSACFITAHDFAGLPPTQPVPRICECPCIAFPPTSPCHALQQGSTALLFLYSCPEASAVRAKMLHASCKGAVLTSLAERGMAVAKVSPSAAADVQNGRPPRFGRFAQLRAGC
jgi:hypothetical protein